MAGTGFNREDTGKGFRLSVERGTVSLIIVVFGSRRAESPPVSITTGHLQDSIVLMSIKRRRLKAKLRNREANRARGINQFERPPFSLFVTGYETANSCLCSFFDGRSA
jgi:hypothetical protein